MNSKKNNIYLFTVILLCIGIYAWIATTPILKDPLTQINETVYILPNNSQVVKLPVYTPARRTAYTMPEAPALNTALPLANSGVGNYQVHRSNMQTYSVGGGVTQNESNAHIASSRPATTYTPTYNPIATMPGRALAHNHNYQIYTPTQSATMQRAPGSLGGEDDEGGEGSSWQGWIDQYYGKGYNYGDLSGLQDWWNGTYGGGYSPDIWTDFYDWAQRTQVPLPDGLLFSLLLAAGYAIRRRFATGR